MSFKFDGASGLYDRSYAPATTQPLYIADLS